MHLYEKKKNVNKGTTKPESSVYLQASTKQNRTKNTQLLTRDLVSSKIHHPQALLRQAVQETKAFSLYDFL